MKILISLIMLTMSAMLFADTQYKVRVDGLACPFCAFGIEKKLKAVDASKIDVDLNNGLVMFEMPNEKSLSEDDMAKLFNDSGFTYRSVQKSESE